MKLSWDRPVASRLYSLTRPLFVAAIPIFAFAVGCSQSSDKHALSGSVTLKSLPLKVGSIQFESLGGEPKTFSSGAMISDGHFAVPVKSGLPLGKYRVMINAASEAFVTPGPPGSQPILDTKELVPA